MSTVVYAAGFEPYRPGDWYWPYPTTVGTVTIATQPASDDEMSDATLVAEVIRRVLEGTISPKARELLEMVLDRK